MLPIKEAASSELQSPLFPHTGSATEVPVHYPHNPTPFERFSAYAFKPSAPSASFAPFLQQAVAAAASRSPAAPATDTKGELEDFQHYGMIDDLLGE